MPITPRCNKRLFFDRPVWNNSTGTVQLHPLHYYEPTSRAELEACVSEGIKYELHVRAVGSGHSFSDAPLTEDILVGTRGIQRVLGTYAHTKMQGLFREVEAGIKVCDLNKKLDDEGLSIRAMGGYDRQTIAGAILTGTHGSSLTFGAMSGMVRSLVLVTNDLKEKGKVRSYRIEREQGFTDPGTYPKDEPELIQDDEVFNSVVVSFGAMGLVYSLVLDVERTYYLEEKRMESDWPKTKALLRNGLLKSGDSVFVQINPYLTKHSAHETTLIMTHRRVPESEVSGIGQDLKWIRQSFMSSIRSPLLLMAGHFQFTYWWLVWRINGNWERIGGILRSAIRAQRDRSYTHKAHRVMFQGAARFKLNAYDSEFALPLNDPEMDYLDVLDELIKELRKLHREHHSHLTAPIGLRFVKGSEVYLTPEHGGDVCYVDCPVLKHAYGHNNIVGRLQHFWQRKKARPHWGKRNEIFTSADIEERYPRLKEWRAQNLRFNWNGIFSNAFTKRLVEPGRTGDAPGVEAPPKQGSPT